MANPIIDGIARLLLCLVFVHAVVNKLIGFQATSTMMTVRGLPLAPLLLTLAMVLMAIGSALVISGWRRRLGAILLLVFLVPTTLIFHTELAQPDQRIALFKNLAIMAGLLLVANQPLPRSEALRR